MSNPYDWPAIRRMSDICLAVSILLLLLHVGHYCLPVWQAIFVPHPDASPGGLFSRIMDRIMEGIGRTGLFGNVFRTKLLALLFLVLSLLAQQGRKDETITPRLCLQIFLPGLLLYLGSVVFLSFSWFYVLLTAAGYLLSLFGGARLSRVLQERLRNKDPFGRLKAGFPQEEKRIESDFALHLPAEYIWEGKVQSSWINIINPRRGVFIMGSPGSGKSWFLIEPMLRQLIGKGFALFLYDFKYDHLTRIAYRWFLEYRGRYPASAQFYSINFTDLSRSHRCNLLEPATLQYAEDALGVSRVILLSINKTWINRQGEFFVESPINFLAAIIWFLRKYEGGKFCTLPHVIELIQLPYDILFSVLNCELEVRSLIRPFIDAYLNNSMEMLDGQISSARIPLARLASPQLYYVLTGSDCSLAINDPAAPSILCLGGDPTRREALAPVLSLYIDRLNRIVNRKDRYPCALVCDEFATVRAFSMGETINTARSNNIIPILAVQDLNQLRTLYTRDEADLFLHVCGNLFCGQTGGETARWVSERIPRVQQVKTTVSVNSSDTSVSHSLQWDQPVNPATLACLSSGEFVGMVADDPDVQLPMKAFHARLRREEVPSSPLPELPLIGSFKEEDVAGNYQQVKADVLGLARVEIDRMLQNPDLEPYIVERKPGQMGKKE